jgi:hypothetical protein
MEMQYNINKIHGSLVTKFNGVKIEEKSSHKFGNYFELTASKGKKNVKMIISKKDVENDTFKWLYYANPLNENSDLVERVSNVDNIYDHVVDIMNNNRFNKDYLDTIKNNNQ